ncbi:hypothetical protein OS493_007776 [Desmophyllum pertusum]|uniref:Uncharacterized protein n=1 Tax=Desmophyllum pertusum TaxID=174260 RepID=A0A9X0CLM5_9CNID|nr:hypothetical protein OS493_007776 [Desmophyllum pertusum]
MISTSTWRQMNLDASRAYFPAKKPGARNGGDDAFGNLYSPGLGPKSSDLFLDEQQPFARDCLVKLKNRGVNWRFISCGNGFVDDSSGKASVLQLCVVQFAKDIINVRSIVMVEHTN